MQPTDEHNQVGFGVCATRGPLEGVPNDFQQELVISSSTQGLNDMLTKMFRLAMVVGAIAATAFAGGASLAGF